MKTRSFISVMILCFLMVTIVPVSAGVFSDTYDFDGTVLVPREPMSDGWQQDTTAYSPDVFAHFYATDLATDYGYPWAGYSSSGWNHWPQVVENGNFHYQYTVSGWTDDERYLYFRLDLPKNDVPVSARPLNIYGKALDSQTMFYDVENLPLGDYSMEFRYIPRDRCIEPDFTESFSFYGDAPPQDVVFDAKVRQHSECDPIVSYQWYFGDEKAGSPAPAAQGPSVRHTYQKTGDYPVILRVTDTKGYQFSKSHTITVVKRGLTAVNSSDPERISKPCQQGYTRCGLFCADTGTDTNNCGACDHRCLEGGTCENGQCTGVTAGGIPGTPFLNGLFAIPQAILSLVGIAPELSPEDGMIVNDQKVRDSVSVSGISPPPDANGQAVAGNDPSGDVQVVVLPGSAGNAGSPGSKIVSEPAIVILDSGTGIDQAHPIPLPSPSLPEAVVMNIPTTGIASGPGMVSPAGIPCPVGNSRCDGICTNLLTDSANCGACGLDCGQGWVCATGTCIKSFTPEELGDVVPAGCSQGEESCEGICVNLSMNPSNCGSCGHVCMSGVSCTNGQCVAQVVTTQPTRLGGVGKMYP